MGPVALLVFKTSAPANTGLVSSTLTRLRHPLGNSVKIEAVPVFLAPLDTSPPRAYSYSRYITVTRGGRWFHIKPLEHTFEGAA
jgi:hypothetical protein